MSFRSHLFLLMTTLSCSAFFFNHFTSSSINARKTFDVNTQQSFSWTLASRNRIRFKRLIDEYRSIVNITALEENPVFKKTLIYSCRSFCGGWGDRLRGILSAYILALLSNRRFLIDMNFPCDIEKGIQPHRVDWTYSSIFKQKNRTRLTINTMASWQSAYRTQITELIRSKDFVRAWFTYDDVVLSTNADYIVHALKNPFVSKQVQHLFNQTSVARVTMENLFPFLYEFLFQPSVSVRRRVDVILGAAMNRPLVCFHIRLGKNPSNQFDYAFRSRENTSQVMMQYVDQHHWNQSEPLIFVTSDSSEAIADVLHHYPTSSMTIVGPILHIDRFDRRTARTCDGFEKVIADFYVLGECQSLFASRSGFSRWAHRRREHFNSNFFIFEEKSGRLQKS